MYLTFDFYCWASHLVPGVYQYLRGRIYVGNNSYVDIDEIGEGDDGALLCVNDPVQCCHMGVDTLGDTVLGPGGFILVEQMFQ